MKMICRFGERERRRIPPALARQLFLVVLLLLFSLSFAACLKSSAKADKIGDDSKAGRKGGAGGLIVSQMVTLFTTPVIYLYLDRLQIWWQRRHAPVTGEGPAYAD